MSFDGIYLIEESHCEEFPVHGYPSFLERAMQHNLSKPLYDFSSSCYTSPTVKVASTHGSLPRR